MSCVKHALYDALEQKYISDKAHAVATLKLSFENPVAIGEHPTLLADMDKLVCDIAAAEENLAALRNNIAEDMLGGVYRGSTETNITADQMTAEYGGTMTAEHPDAPWIQAEHDMIRGEGKSSKK